MSATVEGTYLPSPLTLSLATLLALTSEIQIIPRSGRSFKSHRVFGSIFFLCALRTACLKHSRPFTLCSGKRRPVAQSQTELSRVDRSCCSDGQPTASVITGVGSQCLLLKATDVSKADYKVFVRRMYNSIIGKIIKSCYSTDEREIPTEVLYFSELTLIIDGNSYSMIWSMNQALLLLSKYSTK